MAKADHSPPFKMRVDGLHLVPATAWDAERLSTYRNKSEVNVVITQEVASWRRRKYWAVLGMVVKTCPVQQKTATDLHRAVRLKLGIVDSFVTLSGAVKVELRSTSTMDEQEFEAFYHEAMELLSEVTGVDVETLRKESADVGHDEEQDQPDGPQAHDPADSGEAPCKSGPAASNPESAAADPSPEEAGPPPPASSGDDTPPAHAPMRDFARRLIAVIGAETQFALDEAGRLVKELGITAEADVDRARSAAKYAARSCGDYTKEDKLQKKTAIRFIAGIVGVEEKDLVA